MCRSDLTLGHRIIFVILLFSLTGLLFPPSFAQSTIEIPTIDIPTVDIPSPQTEVPQWIKITMGYWADGLTTDKEFLNAVEFLANEGVIKVVEPTSTDPSDIDSQSDDPETKSGGFDTETEMLSMSLARADSFFDIFYETHSVESFFDIFIYLQRSTDSFFDVFFDVETPRNNDCSADQELKFDAETSSWVCTPADATDSFFDVFFEVTVDTSQNSEDIAELERRIAELESKLQAQGLLE